MARFVELKRAIWERVQEEVTRSMELADG